MKVFISWSGERSRAVAEALDEWLQCVLQAIDPWMSTKDIDRGSLWFSELSDQLANTKIGIICLTQENKEKPWILFEAGALAKGLSSSRVCTFLIDLEPTDVGNPLAQFNHTLPTKEGVFDLVRTINSSLGELALKEKILGQVFQTYWPSFDESYQAALESYPPAGESRPRTTDNMMEEVLTSVRTLNKRIADMETSELRSKPPWQVRKSRSGINLAGMTHPSTAQITEFVRVLVLAGLDDEDILREAAISNMSASFVNKMIKGTRDTLNDPFAARKSTSEINGSD